MRYQVTLSSAQIAAMRSLLIGKIEYLTLQAEITGKAQDAQIEVYQVALDALPEID